MQNKQQRYRVDKYILKDWILNYPSFVPPMAGLRRVYFLYQQKIKKTGAFMLRPWVVVPARAQQMQ